MKNQHLRYRSVAQPLKQSTVARSTPVRVSNIPGGIRIRQSEQSIAIQGSADFNAAVIPIDPSSVIMAEYLTVLASGFSKAKMVQFGLTFRNAVSGTKAGNVYMAATPDPSHDPPRDSATMSNFKDSTYGSVTVRSNMSVANVNDYNRSFQHLIATSQSTDGISNYRFGQIFVGVEGYDGVAGDVVGWLDVQYTFDLTEQRLPDSSSKTASFAGAAAISAAAPFGSSVTKAAGHIQVDYVSGTQVRCWTRGWHRITCTFGGVGCVAPTVTVVSPTGQIYTPIDGTLVSAAGDVAFYDGLVFFPKQGVLTADFTGSTTVVVANWNIHHSSLA
jgi:hypothetical protein